jgi:gluconolactonase
VVNHGGPVYLTEPGTGDENTGKVWLIKPDGMKLVLVDKLRQPTGIALSPGGVAESKTHWGYSYRVKPDGTVQDKQRFYRFHVSDETDDSGTSTWAMDRDGRLYAATRMGAQVFDRNGRVRAILPVPGGEVTGLSFGGAAFDEQYVSCADHKLYRRRLKTLGAPPWAHPTELPPWNGA